MCKLQQPFQKGETMANHIGIWIDRKQAVMVILDEQGEQIRRLVSGASKRVQTDRKVRSKNPNGTQPLPAEDRKDRQFRSCSKIRSPRRCRGWRARSKNISPRTPPA